MIAGSHFLYGTLLFSYDRLLKFAIHLSDIYLLYPILFIRCFSSLRIANDTQLITNRLKHFLVLIFCHLQCLRTSSGSEVRLSYILDNIIKHVALLPFPPVDFWWILKMEMSRCPDLMAAFAVLMVAQAIPRSIVVFLNTLFAAYFNSNCFTLKPLWSRIPGILFVSYNVLHFLKTLLKAATTPFYSFRTKFIP